jgi:hypothetical protein
METASDDKQFIYLKVLLVLIRRAGACIYRSDDTFLATFLEVFGIDLSRFMLKYDQGSDLAKFIGWDGFTQRFCLRHFLVALKDHIFSVFVHHPVKTRTESEFNLLCRRYPVEIQRAIDQLSGTDLKRAKKSFEKLM